VRKIEWRDRAHFFALASKVMRGLPVDRARERNALRRGGDRQRLTLNEESTAGAAGGRGGVDLDLDLLDLHEALAELAELDRHQEQVVELRCFGGLGVEEVAEILGVSKRTVDRDWQWAKAWLRRRLDA
jgi:RNA polymerase sigma factor (TIGR02999 family)